MPAVPPALLPALFAALALVFAGLAWRTRTGEPGRQIRARTYRRLAVIFALVSVGLILLTFVRS